MYTHYEALLRKTHWKHTAKKQEEEIRTDEKWQRLFISEKIKSVFHHWPYFGRNIYIYNWNYFDLAVRFTVENYNSEGRKKVMGQQSITFEAVDCGGTFSGYRFLQLESSPCKSEHHF